MLISLRRSRIVWYLVPPLVSLLIISTPVLGGSGGATWAVAALSPPRRDFAGLGCSEMGIGGSGVAASAWAAFLPRPLPLLGAGSVTSYACWGPGSISASVRRACS